MLPLAFYANYLGIPLLALVLALWARARALAPRDGDRTTAWFPFVRRIQAISLVTIIASMLANFGMVGSATFDRATTFSSGDWNAIEVWALVFFPALVIQWMMMLFAHGVSRALDTTELTWTEVHRQAAWSGAAYVCVSLGLSGMLVSVTDFLHGARAFASWLFVAVFGGAACSMAFQRSVGLTPHALTHGALRDRLFELAGRAGVRLRQLYLLPMRRMRMGNAFAVQNEVVLVTDLLLERLDRDEVDAIMAHEIAHLRHRHPTKLGLVRAAPIGIAIAAGGFGHWIAALVLATIAWLAANAIARAFERTADREVPGLGANGEALVTGLVKLAKIAHLPIAWSRLSGWFLTHPSIAQRAERMGRQLELSPERVATLLAWAPPGPERYPAELAVAENTRLFSTPFKHGVTLRIVLSFLAASAFVPALIARLALPLAPADRGWAWLAALVLTPAFCLLLIDLVAAAPLHALRERLRARLMRPEAGVDTSGEDAVLCAFGPHAEARIYEGFTNWDLGFVWFDHGRLRYRGEETDFALAPGQVVAVELAAGAPSWIPTRVVRVRWRDVDGEERAFRLGPIESRRLSSIGPRARTLHERLERWRRENGPVGSYAAPDASPPVLAITSLWPRELLTAQSYRQIPAFALLLAAIACGVFGAPFWPVRGMGFLEVAFTSAFTQVLLMVPVMRDRGHLAARDAGEPDRRVAA